MIRDLDTEPAVSVIISNFNGAAYLGSLLQLLGNQSLAAIEIIVVDDASSDNSVAIARAASAADSRIHVEELPKNSGPATARNAGLRLARGTWIAIVDSDDLIHPCRFERLIRKAEEQKADIIADDLLVFYEDGSAPHRFLKGRRAKVASEISLQTYIRENAIFTPKPALGFLKPLFRRDAIEKVALRYNEDLRIGEDYDFILRALASGLKLWIEPEALYLYRKHSRSLSHTLTNADIEKMLTADYAFISAQPSDLRHAFGPRLASLRRAKAWNGFVQAAKERQPARALACILSTPSILPLLTWPVRARINRAVLAVRTRPQPANDRNGKSVCLISRQRLSGATSGSSRYVLSLAAALDRAGYEVHLVQPSPTVFGRLPVQLLGAEAKVFRSIKVRGGAKLGPFIIAKNPRILSGFARGAFARAARKLGWHLEDRPAPYSVAAPWNVEDYLFVARNARPVADLIMFDYAFQTDSKPYVLRPDAKSFVLMHDLVSSRKEQFAKLGSSDSLPQISEQEEFRMLTGADVIVAIQDEEAAYVRAKTGGHPVVCAPIAIDAARKAHPGEPGNLLFVGTKTAPNVDGLNWFLENVWPLIVAKAPDTRLRIAGSISRMLGAVPKNVSVLGVVPDLQPFYETCGVVISPLLAGSGLKIKLIEALAHGKAIVATSPTVQGVSALVSDAVAVTDDPVLFCEAVVRLSRDDTLRTTRAEAALDIAKRHFSAEASYREFLDTARGISN